MKVFVLLIVAGLMACRREPIVPVWNAEGIVITEERCHSDRSQNRWLVELRQDASGHTGDSLSVNSDRFVNLVKVARLPDSLRVPNTPIMFTYDYYSSDQVKGTCNVNPSQSYFLHEMFLVNARRAP